MQHNILHISYPCPSHPQGMVLGSILVPIRVFLAVLCFLIMWPIARLRLAGLSEVERSRPVTTGWRRWLLHPIIWFLSRAVFFFLGFFWFRVKGCRAGHKEAPVLAVAPHSSFLDMLVLTETQLPTVVSRSENQSIPVIGGECFVGDWEEVLGQSCPFKETGWTFFFGITFIKRITYIFTSYTFKPVSPSLIH